MDIVRSETAADEELKLLHQCILSHDDRSVAKQLKEYHGIFHDLWSTDGVILKGCQVVIPKSLRAEVIGLAHEGHQHAEKTLSLLRQSSWFPKMRRDVLDYVDSCIACLAAIPQVTPVPMQPNMLPDGPMAAFACRLQGTDWWRFLFSRTDRSIFQVSGSGYSFVY